jgi:sigma-E factor negative regulatory protein RseA
MMDTKETRELMSALADGELRGEAFATAMDALADDPAAFQAWQAYHVVGDVLRSADLAGGCAPDAFLALFRRRAAAEVAPAVEVARVPPVRTPAEAANDASFRWKLVAGFASVTAVGAIAWSMVGTQPNAGAPRLAAVPPGAVLASSERGPMIRDPRLDELLAAHRQLGGASALQQPAGFLRNATFDGPGR